MKARLKNYRQAPRKVRLVADTIRGKQADRALITLSFLRKRAARSMKKLIESALANAKDTKGLNKENLFVEEIRVDKGFTFKRYRARSRGRSAPIRKETSHISVTLSERPKEQKTSSNKIKAEKPTS